MLRHAEQTARTEVYRLPPHKRILSLKGFPVNDAVTFTVKVSTTRDFSESTALTEDTDYSLEPEIGVIRFFTRPTGTSHPVSGALIQPAFVQVVYTGGMATNVAGIVSSFPEVARAADLQVAYLWKRRSHPGGNLQLGGQSGTDYQEKEYGYLRAVLDVIGQHKRHTA